jgi:hypothetical protein
MIILSLIGWTLLTASWMLPEKFFYSPKQMYEVKIVCNIMALITFTIGLLNLLFKWF